ncbi:MAG TPA: hypothetical protein VFW45_14475 [Candidatus Polarisedimenticolia bacterium]|nr:hypothetical protein [Candidatus Polarisedimenticolia bacterium]
MRKGMGLIGIVAVTALSGCAAHYHMPAESEPHAMLSFDQGKGARAWPLTLNGGRPIYVIRYRRIFRIGVGAMRLKVGETRWGDINHYDPFFTCDLSFDAEAGRRYLVSMRWEEDHCWYAVTADNGTKVAECEALERCEQIGARAQGGLCQKPPAPGGVGKGEGAICIRDDAPVYRSPDGTRVFRTLKRGNAVVAVEPKGRAWEFYEESGRTRIAFPDGFDRSIGWMKVEDLARFTYDFCVFDPGLAPSPPPGYPFTTGKRMIWNVCFKKARDAKLKDLGVVGAED